MAVAALVLAGAAVAAAALTRSGPASLDAGRRSDGSRVPQLRRASPVVADPLAQALELQVEQLDPTVDRAAWRQAIAAGNLGDVVAYAGIPAFVSAGTIDRPADVRPGGLLSWVRRLPDGPLRTIRGPGGLRFVDPRTIAVQAGIDLAELGRMVAALHDDPSIGYRQISHDRAYGYRARLAWWSWIDRYPLRSQAWIARASTASVPIQAIDVLFLLPVLSPGQIADLRAGRVPFDADQLWGLTCAALDLWSIWIGTPASGAQFSTYYWQIYAGSQFGGGLDRNPSTSETQEALGWFSALVVGPAVAALSAIGGKKGGGTAASGSSSPPR